MVPWFEWAFYNDIDSDSRFDLAFHVSSRGGLLSALP